MHDIKTLIGRLNFMANQRALSNTVRRAMLGTVAIFRAGPQKLTQTLKGLAETEAVIEGEMASWLDPDDIASGKSGAFDACDLRIWLLIAEKADVPFVPAREILSLSEDELSSICPSVEMPEHVKRGLARTASRMREVNIPESADEPDQSEACATLPKVILDLLPKQNAGGDGAGEIDPRALISERLFTAMDDVPNGWIVRSHLAGSSTLKAFAGSGVSEDADDNWRPGDPDITVGAGWVLHGNRRRVDATEARFLDTFPGHKPRMHYLARPWVRAARRLDGPDPHRHGTPFAGKGSWPAEWRVFVRNGEVTGVACYYGWVGEASPIHAQRALLAAEAGRKIVAQAKAMGLNARVIPLEMLRAQVAQADEAGQPISPVLLDEMARWPQDGLHCSLDFIETEDERGNCVMTFLEGGPAHSPAGGGHPCAFAGHGIRKETGKMCRCEGVALKLMDHVILADPETWKPGETRDHILSWEEAHALASNAD